MPSLKRSYAVANGDADFVAPLHRVRNMWQFANLVQWIYIFGKAAKIDDSIDVEVIENEALKPSSPVLQDIALALVKMASSFRGITSDGLDDQLRKLYHTHSPDSTPFGDDGAPISFDALDGFAKICVLQQLTQWIMIHPERFRDKMDEQRDIDQTTWRIEPYGWDSEDRTYYVLDDNRLYRLTEPPPPPPPTKKLKKAKAHKAGRRSSRRHRLSAASLDEEDRDADAGDFSVQTVEYPRHDTLGGMVWECIAVTLAEVEAIIDSFSRSRDENEKVLRSQIQDHLLPILQKQEDSRKRREQQRERELLNQARMANAKRSSRIAGKIEQQKQDEDAKMEEVRMRQAEAAQRREEADRLKRERERDFRMASREDRLKERELRRRRHEEQLAQLSEDSRNLSEHSGRVSERKLQADIERNQQALKELEDEDEDWIFDCTCGLYGRIDDGEHSIACEKCNVWQHSKCIGISEAEAERSDFRFVCPRCLRLEQEAVPQSKPSIKLKLHSSGNRPSSSAGIKPSIVVELPLKALQPGFSVKEEPTAAAACSASLPDLNPKIEGTKIEGTICVASSTSRSYSPKSTSGKGSEKPSHMNFVPLSDGKRMPTDAPISTYNRPADSPVPLSLKTPSQYQPNDERLNGSGPRHLLATPSLTAHGPSDTPGTNGVQASPGGISPIKSSPQVPTVNSTSSDAFRSTKLVLSPMTSLAPAPSPQDPTPPIKPLDVRGSFSPEMNMKDLSNSKTG